MIKRLFSKTRVFSASENGRQRWIDPPGWDETARRCHDVEPTPNGLLHFSSCWCRR